jgi:predicted metal-dependent HD superfamily phosphohydrolase
VEELLRAQWHSAVDGVRDAGSPELAWTASEDAFVRLLARYREPHRHYHSVSHLGAVMTTAEELMAQVDVDDPAAVRLALFFHDAVYDPRSTTNEAASAALARAALAPLGLPRPRMDAIERLILSTVDHQPPPGCDAGSAAVVLDADLAILSAEPARYGAYVAGVRAEYGHVDEPGWRRGRAAVLQRLLERPTLYRCAPMAGREPRARANLAAELAGLGPPW